MIINNKLKIKSREKLRSWLIKNVDNELEFYVIVKKGSPDYTINVLPYLDAVEEALCFGFIDTTTHKTDEGLLQKFIKRKPNGRWSELNKERVRRLEKLGLMTEYGRAVLPNMHKDAFIVDDEIIKAFNRNKKAYTNFIKFPKLYQIVRIDNIQGYKNDKELFARRLKKLIDASEQNIMYGEWNDYGRLDMDRSKNLKKRGNKKVL